ISSESIRFLFRLLFFFFNDTASTEFYTLSLHDALPISPSVTGGTRWYLFSQRSSGNFAKSAMYSIRVSLYLSEMIQPTCDQKNPKSVGECKSSSWSECR